MVCAKCGARMARVPLTYYLCDANGYRLVSESAAFCRGCGAVCSPK